MLLYNGKVERYKASVGQKVYLENRQNSRKNYRCLEIVDFLRYVKEKVITAGWSIDACVGYAKKNHQFEENEMVCTKTLYNYIDSGLLSITNMDLPEKLSRNTKAKKVRKNKKNLGKSIEDYSADDIMYFADKINNLPRKILNYHTPEELFEKQLDLIYAA